MEIDLLEKGPKDNIVEFKAKREPALVAKNAPPGACQHPQVIVDQATRTVSCSGCHAPLDPFTVLWEMAIRHRSWFNQLDEWDAYRESILSRRYDIEWERHRGDILEPPNDPALRKIWDTFHACLGDRFCGMYRRKRRKRKGPEWYGRFTDGGMVSYEYAKSKLTPKIGAK